MSSAQQDDNFAIPRTPSDTIATMRYPALQPILKSIDQTIKDALELEAKSFVLYGQVKDISVDSQELKTVLRQFGAPMKSVTLGRQSAKNGRDLVVIAANADYPDAKQLEKRTSELQERQVRLETAIASGKNHLNSVALEAGLPQPFQVTASEFFSTLKFADSAPTASLPVPAVAPVNVETPSAFGI